MTLAARLLRVALMLAGAGWGAGMVVVGLGAITCSEPVMGLPERAVTFLGAAGVAGGQFVFSVLVADRCFPDANANIVLTMEVVTFTLFLLCLAAAGYSACAP